MALSGLNSSSEQKAAPPNWRGFFLAVVVTTFFLYRANDCGIIQHMIGLTDTQLKIVMNAARLVPVEKRDIFLQRIAAMLALRGRGRFTDTDGC